MAVMRLPEGCRGLIVNAEPLEFFALDCLLQEMGSIPLGPASCAQEVAKLVQQDRPNFALVDVNLREILLPAVDSLDRNTVPFAIMAIGSENDVIDRIPALRQRPRLRRPFHAPSVYAATRSLYLTDLQQQIARVDEHIAQGQVRLAQQLRLIERIAPSGQATDTAEALAREIGRALGTMRASRDVLVRQLGSLSGQTPSA